jgi:hypothetical protein
VREFLRGQAQEGFHGVYQKYAMSDAALSAFSVFFMQSPSFLDDQKTMEKERGKNNYCFDGIYHWLVFLTRN